MFAGLRAPHPRQRSALHRISRDGRKIIFCVSRHEAEGLRLRKDVCRDSRPDTDRSADKLLFIINMIA
jgi:hypothetical protein